jgi:hypothetical protein
MHLLPIQAVIETLEGMDLSPAQVGAPTLLVIVGISAEVYVSRRTIYVCVHLGTSPPLIRPRLKRRLAMPRNAQTLKRGAHHRHGL